MLVPPILVTALSSAGLGRRGARRGVGQAAGFGSAGVAANANDIPFLTYRGMYSPSYFPPLYMYRSMYVYSLQ